MLQANFLFDVYDNDNTGCISREEMLNFIVSSLSMNETEDVRGEGVGGADRHPDAMGRRDRLTPSTRTTQVKTVCNFFVEQTFAILGIPPERGYIERADVLQYLEANPEERDVMRLFGRSTTDRIT